MKAKKKIIVSILVFALIISLGGFLAGCKSQKEEKAKAAEATQPAKTGGLIDTIVRRGVMKVGIGIFVPWAFKDKDGNLVGFEIDVAKKLAKDMGVKVEFVPTDWSGIIPALLTGKFDVIIGGMGTTTERALKVNFTIPYEFSGMDCVVNKKKLPNITSLEQLNKKAVVIAVHMGATPAAAAKKFTPNATLHQFDTDAAVLQDVLNGSADAALSSSPTPAFWAYDHPDVLYRPLKGKLFTYEPEGFAVKKGDPDAIFFFNTWIRANKLFLEERSHYWYETKDWKYLLGE